MYMIVNYDHWWRYPKVWNNFKDCFMMYELLGDYTNVIECHNDGITEIVWNGEMENTCV